jgi:hypothetical protein
LETIGGPVAIIIEQIILSLALVAGIAHPIAIVILLRGIGIVGTDINCIRDSIAIGIGGRLGLDAIGKFRGVPIRIGCGRGKKITAPTQHRGGKIRQAAPVSHDILRTEKGLPFSVS